MSGRKLNRMRREAVLKAWRAGVLTAPEIAREFGINRTTVRRIINENASMCAEDRMPGWYCWECPMCRAELMAADGTIPDCPTCTERAACGC